MKRDVSGHIEGAIFLLLQHMLAGWLMLAGHQACGLMLGLGVHWAGVCVPFLQNCGLGVGVWMHG